MATKTRIRKTTATVPQNRSEAAAAIAKVGTLQAEIDKIEAEIEAEVLAIKAARASRIEAIRKDRNSIVTGLCAFASANREKLLSESGGKTIGFATGSLAWRYSPPAVAVADDDQMIAYLKKIGQAKYIRTKEELDRESLLRDREKISIRGVGFSQREDFIVKPNEKCSEVKKTRTIVLG